MKKKITILFLISIFLACIKVKEKGTKIRVMYWGSPEEIKIITDTVSEWQKKHPEINVALEHSKGGPDYISKLLTQVAGNYPPDIAFVEVNVFVPLFEKGIFLDLTPFIQNDKEFNIKDFFEPVVKRFTRGGKIYAIPRDTAPFACVFYNKNLFDREGIPYPKDDWTFDDLLKIAKRLTKRDEKGNIIQYGFYSWCWMNFVYGFGGSIVDNVENPTKCLLGSLESLKGLQFYADLCNKYKVSPAPLVLRTMDQGPIDLFMSGKLAMFSSGIWETPRLRTITDFDWDVVMFPKGPKRRGFGTGGSGYAILKGTKHPKEAFEVLKCLAGDWGQQMLGMTGLAQPANKRIAESKYFALNNDKPLNKKMLNKAVQWTIYEPFHSKWQEAQDKYLNEGLDYLFSNQITTKEFAEKYATKINELMFGKE